MKFDFKRIASAATSVAMVGSTVGLAMAASFPAPFVDGGVGDYAIVYGSSLDLSAVTDISSSLSSQTTSSEGSSAGSTPEGGDFVLLAKASDNVNLGDTLSGVFGTTVKDDDLEVLLADGVYTNDENTDFDFEQKLTLGSALQLNFFEDGDYKDNAPTIGFNLSASDYVVFNYTLNFLDQPESDVSGGDLVDFETTDLPILGRDYFVLDADNSTLKFTLLDSANSAIVSEGETTTVTSGSTTFDVGITFISTSEVVLNVNGEDTNSLAEGGTYKLSDGSYLGIKDILASSKTGTIDKVEFSIGTGKLELPNGANIELNDDTVNEITSYVTRGTHSGGKELISSIVLEWKTDDDEFLTPEGELVMPGFEALKFSMNDFNVPSAEIAEVKKGSSRYMQLTAEISDGEVTIPILYSNNSGEFVGIGKDNNNLLVTYSTLTGLQFNRTRNDEWLVASWNDSRDAESYILRFTNPTNDAGRNITDIQKLSDGSWTDTCTKKTDGDTCDIGSLTITVNSVTRTPEKVINFSGNAGSSFHRLYTKEGLEIHMPHAEANADTTNALGVINVTTSYVPGADGDTSASQFNDGASDAYQLVFDEEDKDSNLGSGSSFNVTINDQSDGDVEVASFQGSSISEQHEELEDDDNLVARVKSDLATQIRRVGDSNTQRWAEITYSGDEAFAEVFLTASGTTTGSSSAGGVSVLDTELQSSGMSTKNLIAVGGTCVNEVAATLLGVTKPTCGDDWTSVTGAGDGEWIIQTFTNPWSSSKVATLVGGFEQADTKNAATYMTTQDTEIEVGKKLKGTSATSATMVA